MYQLDYLFDNFDIIHDKLWIFAKLKLKLTDFLICYGIGGTISLYSE